MTDANRSMSELPALLEERRKYEGWLTALEVRRASTPQHVFDRVKADYDSRLERVEEQLSAHRHSIQEERTSLSSRRALLEAEEQLRRDERAELELRVHVGELAGTDADTAFRAVDETLDKMASENQELTGRIEELDLLLEGKAPPSATTSTASPVVAGAPVAETRPSEPGGDSPGDAAPARAVQEISAPPQESFDELAFLNDVVGEKPASKAGATSESIGDSLLADLHGASGRRGDEVPLAANVTANIPIVLRASTAVEQSKTLKCNECGGMNYPTEWYCERCGAELATL